MTDLSHLPQVDAVLRHEDAEAVIETYGRRTFADALRSVIDEARNRARDGHPVPAADEIIAQAARELAERRSRRLRRVVNATGVVLHTNLGRAPLSADARTAIAEASGFCNLEYDLADGVRGSRTGHVGDLAAEACGAEAATVVNNGAAALVLVLAALADDRDAIVSRGELVEIGGSFRLPDVMAASGATMLEVGTTNKTRLEDYRAAIRDRTGLVLKVHRSNYRVVGFTAEPSVSEVAAVAGEHAVPFVYDIGSGLLRQPKPGTALDEALRDEPSAESALADGADLVVFSGDKLLGGPQAGVIAGRRDLVERCDRHPLARALRIDKLRRAALEVTFASHLRADAPLDLPVWAMLSATTETLRRRAESNAEAIGPASKAAPVPSLTGGGTLPGAEIASWGVIVETEQPDDLARGLRRGSPPVVGRVEDGRLVLDLRTVPPAHDDVLISAVRRALGADD